MTHVRGVLGGAPRCWSRSRGLALAILLLAANACAFLALRAGSAYPHVDETQVVATSLHMERVEPKPPEANWPSHTYHALRVERVLLRWLGLLPDAETTWERFRSSWYAEITPLHRASRSLALGFALLTLLATYRLGRVWVQRVPAALGTCVVAVSPLFANYAAFALTDMPHAFWTTVALAAAARLARRKALGTAFLAGFSTSLAVATKYLGGIAAFAVLAAWALGGRTERSRWSGRGKAFAGAALIALGAVAGLAVGMPDAFLVFETADGGRELGFARYLAWLARHEQATDWTWFGFEASPSGWEQALMASLPHAAGSLALLVCAVVGWVAASVRRPREAAVAVLFALLWFAVVGRNQILYTRYWLPLVPWLAVGVAGLVEALVGRPRAEARERGSAWRAGGGARSALAAACATALLLAPARESWRWAEQIHGGDTRWFFPRMLAGYEDLPAEFGAVVDEAGLARRLEILATGHPRRASVPGFEFLHNPAYPQPAGDVVELGLAVHRRPDDLVIWLDFLERVAAREGVGLERLWARLADLQPIVSEHGLRFEGVERTYEALWRLGVRHYLWSEFVDGIYRDLGRAHHPSFQRFLDLVESCPVVIEVDPLGTVRSDLPLVEAEALLSSRLDAAYAGPLLRVHALLEPQRLWDLRQGSGE